MRYNLSININNCIADEIISWIPLVTIFILGMMAGAIFTLYVLRTKEFKLLVLD
jgi:hypothetical protein